MENFKAVHLSGGNFFDRMKVDIEKSHCLIDAIKFPVVRSSKSYLAKLFNYCYTGLLIKTGTREFLVENGFIRQWFVAFNDYWVNVLGGRPITVSDFFLLLHDYRKAAQNTCSLEWETPEQHIANWQDPVQLYSIFHNVRKTAFRPIISRKLWKFLKRGFKILEYGCSIAPYYHCYRNFFTYHDAFWVLADIPNFPFHYAKYLYRSDAQVEFINIHPHNFKDPMKSDDCFDMIILTTVLEHLANPIEVSDYLLDHLKHDGVFVFDYVISDGLGLDTPSALQQRKECLDRIQKRIRIVDGVIDPEKDVSLVISQKNS